MSRVAADGFRSSAQSDADELRFDGVADETLVEEADAMRARRRMLAGRRTMAIVLVEQYYDFAAELADQYLVMERGDIVQRGRGKDMERDGVRRRMSI